MDSQLYQKEFGDYQTPTDLAKQISELLASQGVSPKSVIEPSCGQGSFITAAAMEFTSCEKILGFELNPNYVQQARQRIDRAAFRSTLSVEIQHADFFKTDWIAVLNSVPHPALVLGNPPWITNAALSLMKSSNVPPKTNFQSRKGFAALTGKSNFDISEWMLIRLLEALNETRSGHLAMLCKLSSARKTLRHAWTSGIRTTRSEIRLIDGKEHFGISATACLLNIQVGSADNGRECPVYSSLLSSTDDRVLGIQNNELIGDIEAYRNTMDIDGQSYLRWRSGLKHDASKVMELTRQQDRFVNGFGQEVDIEKDYVYPLLKSSDVANGRLEAKRYVIVTQTNPGSDTETVAISAPKTWNYLLQHADILDGRRSSIYKRRARFAIFGIGDYSFAPWKVAISGLYKVVRFLAIPPVDDKPVMLDDTCYFVACRDENEAVLLAQILNSEPAIRFMKSLMYIDDKRPVNSDLLNRMNIKTIAEKIGVLESLEEFLPNISANIDQQNQFVFEH